MRPFTYRSLVILTAIALAPPPLTGQGYGRVVAVSDADVLIGQSANVITPGEVYVYRKASGGWVEAARLRAPDATPSDGFGSALDAHLGTMLIGASGGRGGTGSVHVFERSPSGSWEASGRLTATGVSPDSRFGTTVAIRGDIAVVGAPGPSGGRRNPQPTGPGAAYVFQRDDGVWTERAKLTSAGTPDGFGNSVAIQDDQILVGAPFDNQSGTVYAFGLSTGQWERTGTLSTPNLRTNDGFGASVRIDGDRALVSAPGRSGGEGAVFTFNFDSGESQWTPTGRLLPFDGFQQDGFGSSMAFASRGVWVGSPGMSLHRGATYLFEENSEGGWSGATKIGMSNLQASDAFGSAIAVENEVAVIGVAGVDFGSGTAAIFERNGDTWEVANVVMGEVEGFDAVSGGQVDCTGGVASAFDCGEYDLVSFMPVRDMAPRGVTVNDVWGWTDPETRREYALVGRRDGSAFVDVTDANNPRYLGQLLRPEGSNPSTWTDIKVYENHAFIVADGAGQHGIQVFDLTQLRDVTEPVTFEETAHYDGVASAHNIVINEESGFAYSVGNRSGGETCGGGLHIINIQEPTNPIFAGCFADPATGRAGTGYTHDAQCVTYRGPDEEHAGEQICMNANETALSIADVTDPANPVALSSASYPSVGYSHQGWLTEDHEYYYMNDELDEIAGQPRTRTLIWDVSDLDDPQLIKEHFGTQQASDHNLYVRGDIMYQSNYQSGLRVLDISDPENPLEIGYFDTVPYGDNSAGMGGSWSNYPFFESGIVIVTSGREGLFVLKRRQPIT